MRTLIFLSLLAAAGCVDRALVVPEAGPDFGTVDLAPRSRACTPGAPEQLVTSDVDALAYQLAAVDGVVYYPGGDAKVRTVSARDGASRAVTPSYAQYLALGGAKLYTTQTILCGALPCNRVVSVDLASDTMTDVANLTPPTGAGPFAADGAGVYWIGDLGAGSIVAEPAPALDYRVLAETEGQLALGIAVDADAVYFAAQAGALEAIDRRTHGRRVLVDAKEGPNLVAVDGDDVFYSTGNGAIRRVPRAGGPSMELAAPGRWAWTLKVRGDHVYWNAVPIPETGTQMRVYRVPRTGGNVEELVSRPSYGLSPMAVDDDCVYFLVQPDPPLPTLPGGLNPPVQLYKVAR